MGNWIKVTDLKPTAQTLALGAEALEDAADKAPALPDAGTSTPAVAAAMITTFQAIARLAQGMAAAADAVQADDADFKTADQSNADHFRGVR